MQRAILLLFTLFSVVYNSAGQITEPAALKPKAIAIQNIQNLKSGALVVRLNFKTKAINALLQAGNTNGANDIRYRQEELNSTIIKAFRNHFRFCPVYFISYDSTTALVNGKQEGVFLNDDLKQDVSIKLHSPFFLFAEYGTIENTLPPDKLNPEQETTTRGLMEDALIVRDKDLQLLRDPFPYYVHTGKWDSRVKKLNKKFEKYYEVSLL